MKWKKLFLLLFLVFIISLSILLATPKATIQTVWKENLQDLGYTNQDIERLTFYYTTDCLKIIQTYQIPSYFTKACFQYQNCLWFNLGKYYQKAKGNTLDLLYTINTINRPNLLTPNSYQEIALLKDTFLILVNRNHHLEKEDIPPSLIEITVVPHIIRPNEAMMINRIAYEHYLKLYEKAKSQGLSLVIYSAYRSYDKQKELFDTSGVTETDYLARPGHSEHQTGLALDLGTIDSGLTEHFEKTPEFTFLKSFAHQEGFILRYPKGKERITGYAYEPWHFRYVGVEAARIIYQENLTFEEYLARYVELPSN